MLTSLWMIGEIFGTSFGTLFGGMAYDAIGFENGLLVVAGIQVQCHLVKTFHAQQGSDSIFAYDFFLILWLKMKLRLY